MTRSPEPDRAPKTFSSSSGKSYSSGSSWSDSGRKSYVSGKSYTAGSGRTFTSNPTVPAALPSAEPTRTVTQETPQFTFDAAAARVRKEEVSKTEFTQFKETQAAATARETIPGNRSGQEIPPTAPPIPASTPAPLPDSYPPARPAPSYSPPAPATVYVPDPNTLVTRPTRVYTVFNPYISRPTVIYQDRYGSLFWWWLLDRSLDDRAYWAYHHRHDMDPARYQTLVANDHELQARVEALENEQLTRDPDYVPVGMDKDLMYSDNYVAGAYSNRPTTGGRLAFWVLGVPTALAVTGFFIWLVWFKRWQTS